MNDITSTTITRADARKDKRSSKRRPLIAFGLAALAIGGIGAAATSAAWTDNVFFSAQAQAATFNLQGSVDGGVTWDEGVENGTVLVVPSTAFANLLPGQTRTFDLQVKNLGSVPAALTSTAAFAGTAFTSDTKVEISGLVASLAPNATDTFTVTVTTPSGWAEANKGKTDKAIIKVVGTATAP